MVGSPSRLVVDEAGRIRRPPKPRAVSRAATHPLDVHRESRPDMKLRRSVDDDRMARLRALHARVHPPAVADDVAALVRRELARERAEVEAQRREADEARYRGGPCWVCGCTSAEAVDVLATGMSAPRPDWVTSSRGPECGTCHSWRGVVGTDDELLDKVASIFVNHGLSALASVNRSRFSYEPGMAARIGVVAWIDSGQPPGVRWGHLAALQRPADGPHEPAAGTDGMTLRFNDLATLPGWSPSWDYGLSPVERQRLFEPREIDDVALRRMRAVARQRDESRERREARRRGERR